MPNHKVTSTRHDLTAPWNEPQLQAITWSTRLLPWVAAAVTLATLYGPAGMVLPDLGPLTHLVHISVAALAWKMLRIHADAAITHVEDVWCSLVADDIAAEIGTEVRGDLVNGLRRELASSDPHVLFASTTITPDVTIVVDRDNGAYAIRGL